MASQDARKEAPATQRNREPILEVLLQVLPQSGTILEIASGTGEHAVFFAPKLSQRKWLPTDANKELFPSINAWAEYFGCDNIMKGWRTFRIIAPDAPLNPGEIMCRHTEDDRIQCETCLLCDGASSKPNVADPVHGLNWKVSNFLKYTESALI